MFEGALLESSQRSPGQQRTLSAAASLLLQCGLLATFILAPLLARQVVPDLPQRITIITPHLETETPPVEASGGGSESSFTLQSVQSLVQPSHIRPLGTQPPEQAVTPAVIGPAHSTGPAGLSSLFSHSGTSIPENPAGRHPIVSVLEQGVVLNRVQPAYPEIARRNRIEGPVHLTAVIAASGNLESLHIVDGHPMLVKAALDAVRQWRFRPYILNGKPIEVQTQITVNFSLN